jgi:hypothetical protein
LSKITTEEDRLKSFSGLSDHPRKHKNFAATLLHRILYVLVEVGNNCVFQSLLIILPKQQYTREEKNAKTF